MTTTTGRTGLDRFTLLSYLVYGLAGWSMSGLGAVLPQLRQSLGAMATVYPSLPGAGLLVLALVTGGRDRPAGRRSPATMITGRTVAHVAGLAVHGLRPHRGPQPGRRPGHGLHRRLPHPVPAQRPAPPIIPCARSRC